MSILSALLQPGSPVQQVGEVLPSFDLGPRIIQEPFVPRVPPGRVGETQVRSLRDIEAIRKFEKALPVTRLGNRFSPMPLPEPIQARFANQLEEFLSLQPNLVLQDFARRAGIDPAPPVEQNELRSELINSLAGALRLVAPSRGI